MLPSILRCVRHARSTRSDARHDARLRLRGLVGQRQDDADRAGHSSSGVARGLTVSLIKHAHHSFDLDQPGKDSHRHRIAGCSEVLVSSGVRWALLRELRGEAELTLPQALARLSPCDLALIEGYKAYPIPKLEIWRESEGKPLLHPRIPTSRPSPRTIPNPSREAAFRRSPWTRWTKSQHLSTRTPAPIRRPIDLIGRRSRLNLRMDRADRRARHLVSSSGAYDRNA